MVKGWYIRRGWLQVGAGFRSKRPRQLGSADGL